MESRVASWKITGKSLVLFFQDSVFCRRALVKVGRGALITYIYQPSPTFSAMTFFISNQYIACVVIDATTDKLNKSCKYGSVISDYIYTYLERK